MISKNLSPAEEERSLRRTLFPPPQKYARADPLTLETATIERILVSTTPAVVLDGDVMSTPWLFLAQVAPKTSSV